MHRTLGITDTAGSDGPGCRILFHCIQGGSQVAEIVQRIEDTDNVNTVLDAQFNEFFDNIIMIVLVTQQVLSAKQHLQPGIGHIFADVPQPLPGIFSQITQAGVKGRATPAFHGIVSGLVHHGQDFFEICIRQPGRHQGLVGVAHYGFGKLYFFHIRESPFRMIC